MRTHASFHQTRLLPRAFALGTASVLILAGLSPALWAADPSSGSINPVIGETVPWDGTAVGGASAGEDTCVEQVNCDTFTLNVLGTQAAWSGKLIDVTISWTLPATDYDLVIHKDSNSGPIVSSAGDGAPDTEETAAIDPSSTGVGVYTVHVVYFSVPPGDQYSGTATVIDGSTAGGRTANYIEGGLDFSPSFTVKAPVAAQDGEPSNRTDFIGNHYTGAIRGVPAGVDVWYFDLNPSSPTYDPFMRNPIYRGQPDEFSPVDAVSVGADGGGDIDLAVGFDRPSAGEPPILAFSSLVAANISGGNSTDRGETFVLNPAGNLTGGVPGDDRQWNEFLGSDVVYLLYRTLAPAVTMIQRSDDGGLTYGLSQTAGAIGQVGSLDVDQNDGTVYLSGSSGMVCAGTPSTPLGQPLSTDYVCNTAASDPNGVDHIFFVVKVADDGTAYVAYSNDKDIFIAHTFDKGANWSDPVRVSDGSDTNTSVFPWLETGPEPGSVGVVWYGTESPTNSDDANWQVFYAVTFNATDQNPTFRQAIAGDHFIHASNISEGGTLGNANRNLLDYFQISFDPFGAAVISYTDDHNDFSGHTFVTRQIGGQSINAKGDMVPAPVEGADLPPPAPPLADGPQVPDFRQDVAEGLLVVVPVDDPLDITSIEYTCDTSASDIDDFTVTATMTVSDLTVVPPGNNWRMNFSANAPFAQVSPTGEFTFGLSDRGDQFFLRARSNATGMQSFDYGTAVRNSDGSLTYTPQGSATGSFNTGAPGTITVTVPVADLNGFATPEIDTGTTFVGLRGQTFTDGANARRDLTRGGTQFTVNCGDADNDNIAGELDNCPTVRNFGQQDRDGDEVGNACDNCIRKSNTSQCDTNGDGFGNRCDADLNNNGGVTQPDLGIFREQFGRTGNGIDADLNCNGGVTQSDLGIFRSLFNRPPGPSAFAP